MRSARPQIRSARSARASVLTATVAVGVLTALVIAVPGLHFAYRSVLSHVAMETAATVIAAIAAALSLVRARRTGAWSDTLLFGTLSLLAVTNLTFSLLPTLFGDADDRFATWAPVAGRFLGALGFLAAALAGTRRLRRPAAGVRWALAGALGTTLLIAVAVAVGESALPTAVAVEALPEESGRPNLDGAPLVLAIQLASVLIFAAAAVGFLWHAEHGAEGARGWLAVAMVVAAGSRLHYFLYPSLYSEYVYVGDFLRVGFYAVLLGGTIAEILGYERRLAGVAVFEERRRLARDLHDGLAQELAFISSQTRVKSGSDEIARAAERALRESRLAISALMRPADEPMAAAVARAAADASRGRAKVEVQAPPAIDASPTAREALLRIVGEAVTNAVRHGQARRVHVEIAQDGCLQVRVRDDGHGFDPQTAARDDAYGLITMRERAEALGGTFRLSAKPGHGAVVEVTLP